MSRLRTRMGQGLRVGECDMSMLVLGLVVGFVAGVVLTLFAEASGI